MGCGESKDCIICTIYEKIVQNILKYRVYAHSKVAKQLANALATISSMINHPNKNYINPLEIDLNEQPSHCQHIEVEPDRKPWYYDIKKYLETGIHPEDATSNQKKALYRLANNFFPSGEINFFPSGEIL